MKKNKFFVHLLFAITLSFYSCATKDAIPTEQKIQPEKIVKESKKEPEDPPNIKFAKQLQKELDSQNLSGAIALFSSIPEELKDDVELKLLLGALYYSNKEFDNSIGIANEVLSLDAKNIEALELISMCNYAKGDKKSYKDSSNKILQLDPYNVNANIQKAEDLALTKKYKLAREAYAKALKGDKDNKDALFGFAQTSYYMGDMANSQKSFTRILESEPDNSSANLYLGKIAAEEENYLLALKYAQKAASADPSNYDCYLDLGNYYRYTGKFKEAIDSWNKAVEIDSSYFLAYVYLAGIYDEQNDFDNALENYHKVIQTNPNYYYAYEETALLEYHAKNYEKAIAYFNKAYEYSNNYSYKLMVNACYQKMGNKIKAKESLTPVLKTLNKDSVEYFMVRFFTDNYNRNAESSLIQKILKEDNGNKRGKMLFYMGLYYELSGADALSEEYYVKVTDMQAPMFFEYRIAEWSLAL